MIAGTPSAAICRSSKAWRTPCIATRLYVSLAVVSTPAICASPKRRASHTAKALSLPELQETNARGAMACPTSRYAAGCQNDTSKPPAMISAPPTMMGRVGEARKVTKFTTCHTRNRVAI